MTRDEMHAAVDSVLEATEEQFGDSQADRAQQLVSHAKTVNMCVDHLFDHAEKTKMEATQ